jgi:integrase
VQVAKQKLALGPLKTKASYRTIPLPDVVLEALSAHLAQFRSTGCVFTDDAGQPLKRTRFSEVWRHACRHAGLADSITMHDLRHYYASLLIQHGESVKVVQARLGHKDATETLNTYAHLWPDSEDSTRAAVDLVLGAERRAVAK